MNRNPECGNIPEEEIHLYDYWKVLVKRKKVFIGICLIPATIVTAIILFQPRHYRGECEIINPVIPPQMIISLLGNFDDTKKAEVFSNTPGAIKSVSMSIPPKPNDKVNIVLEADTADAIPQAFQNLDHYICNLREFKEELARINYKMDLQIEALVEAKKANLLFLGHINAMMRKGNLSSISINPADLIKKDADLSLEIMNLQRAKAKEAEKGSLGPISITTLPSNSTVKQIIVVAGMLSFFAGIFVVFFLEYLHRMKAREKNGNINK